MDEISPAEGACRAAFSTGGLLVGTFTRSPSGMLKLAAAGFVVGVVACKIPLIKKSFEQFKNSDEFGDLDFALSNPNVRKDAIVLVRDQVGVSLERSAEIWDVIMTSIRSDPSVIKQNKYISEAAHHPPTGAAKHGLAYLNITSPNSSTG